MQGIVDSLNKIISSHLGLAPALVFLPKVVMLVGFTILLVGLLNEEQAQLARLAPVGVVVLSLGFLANIYIKHAIRNTEVRTKLYLQQCSLSLYRSHTHTSP